MNPWIETIGVLFLGAAGVWAGRRCARLPKPWWFLGYILPLFLILLIGIAYRFRSMEFHAPFRWLMAGRTEYALTAFLAAMVLTTPLSKLPLRRDRIAVSALMVWVIGQVAAWPFLAPAFNRHRLAALQTHVDSEGVCRQSTDFTCGPAASVTALRRLGLPADEGAIAIRCRSSSAMGTPPDMLCAALKSRYARDGLSCEYRSFRSVAELKQPGCTVALVKFGLLLDHYVTVLEVGDQSITVGDPLLGKQTLSHAEFTQKWRFVGVVLNRDR